MRQFNTSGPNNPEKHYTLFRKHLIEKGQELVRDSRYFTIWAPRQTGKSTYFRLLGKEMEKEGYQTCEVNLGNFKSATEEILVRHLRNQFAKQAGVQSGGNFLSEFYDHLSLIEDKKLIFIVDEVEGINPDFFGQFLHTIRGLYHNRERHSIKSVILVGVNNMLGIAQDNASPFNIAESFHFPYFSDEETLELLGQHEAETGQHFEEKVKKKLIEITANEPGLVNAFANHLVENHPNKEIIDYKDYLNTEDVLLRKVIDKNYAHILNKAQDYRHFLERLLFMEDEIQFRIERPEIKFLHTLGLLKEDENGKVVFWVPFYKKRLYDAFYPYTNGESEVIRRGIVPEEFQGERGSIDFPRIIQNYKEYAKRRGFHYFREKDEQGNYKSIKEAALLYSFETYIQAFVQELQGQTYREAHTGLGRSDLIINIKNQEYLVESKIYYSATRFKDGKQQLAYYYQSLGLSEGLYLVFLDTNTRLPGYVKEGEESIHDVLIKTYLVMYDEEKDF